MIFAVEYKDTDQKTRIMNVNVDSSAYAGYAVKAQNRRFVRVISCTPCATTPAEEVPHYSPTKKEVKQAEPSLF